MTEPLSCDVEYAHDGTRMIGRLVAPTGARALPGLLLVHDAFGLTDDVVALARRLSELGVVVFAADVWGERTTPGSDAEIGPLIGGMVGDRPRWIARVAAALDVLRARDEVDASRVAGLGYCFGGSSVLELLRTGGDLAGVVSVHGGLDLLAPDWSAARGAASVLLCTGADDPMATAEQREALQGGLDSVGIDWELDLYSGTVHAFTNPKSAFSPDPAFAAYHPRNAARAEERTTRFLAELLLDTVPSA